MRLNGVDRKSASGGVYISDNFPMLHISILDWVLALTLMYIPSVKVRKTMGEFE